MKNIIDNKLIIEFMGGVYKDYQPELTYPEKTWKDIQGFPDIKKTYNIKYHSSWDWLMPVIEKIESLKCVIQTTSSPTISKKWYSYNVCIKTNDFNSTDIVYVDSDYDKNESKISTYYRAVIEFIKWYNNKS